jgi:hypothetical protein
MRRFSIPVALTVLLVSAVALADNDKVVSQFEALAASGISGQARVNPMDLGSTRIQVQLDGLQPGVQYQSAISLDGTCTSGGAAIATFTANPAGKGHFNVVVNQDIGTIGSLSVQRAGDPTVQACAAVNP